jgi:hypothetical protein
MTVGVPGGLQIRITASELKLGKGATDFVPLTSKVEEQLRAIERTLGSLTGQAAFGVPYQFTGSVAASKVRAE